MQIDQTTRGLALAILAGIIFGTAAIFTRAITGISALAIAASRLTLGLLCMGVLIGGQGSTDELKRSVSQIGTFVLLGVLSSFHFLLFVLAVQHTFVANALILVNTAPILVLLLAPILLKESITPLDIASVIVTFAGAGLIVGFDKMRFQSAQVFGDLYALGSAFCYALYIILARKLRSRYSSPVIMCWFFGLGAFFLWVGGIFIRKPLFSSPSAHAFLFVLLLGILPTGIGHFAYNLSLKYVPATKASTIVLLEPVSGTLFAWMFLHEIPPFMSLVGVLIALTGIGMAAMVTHKE